MLDLVDTHCHIQSAGQSRGEAGTIVRWQKLGLSREEIYDRALGAGVKTMICVGCDLDDSALAAELAGSKEGLSASVGVHPHEAKRYRQLADLKRELSELAKLPKVVAIGECGLDFYYSHSSKEDQLKVLEAQLEVAAEAGLPVIFHVREAFADFWPLYDRFKLPGVVHSFSDNQANLEAALERGLYIGVNGIATFSKQTEVYKRVPLSKLVLETDAPYLSPAPDRGKTNQPSQVVRVAEFLAELRSESLEELAKRTTANARELFGL